MEKDSLAVQMGQNIAELRREHHLTQAQLAEQLGVNAAHVSRVECGGRILSPHKIQLTSKLFEVSYDAIFLGPESDPCIQNIVLLLKARPKEYAVMVENFLRLVPAQQGHNDLYHPEEPPDGALSR